MVIVALSDTHGLHASVAVPPGDILVHAGDLTSHGTLDEVVAFNAFLGTLPHRHKLVIAGNHDFCFEQEARRGTGMHDPMPSTWRTKRSPLKGSAFMAARGNPGFTTGPLTSDAAKRSEPNGIRSPRIHMYCLHTDHHSASATVRTGARTWVARTCSKPYAASNPRCTYLDISMKDMAPGPTHSRRS